MLNLRLQGFNRIENSMSLNKKIKYRLALDLGSTSLGWAIFRLDRHNTPNAIIKAGVRIFSDGHQPKTVHRWQSPAAPHGPCAAGATLAQAQEDMIPDETGGFADYPAGPRRVRSESAPRPANCDRQKAYAAYAHAG